MSNATSNIPDTIQPTSTSGGPLLCSVPVKGTTHVYKGTVISQHSGGYYVPATTSGGGSACGIAQHEINNTGSDGDKRVQIEFMREYAFPNGTSGDAFSDVSVFGAPVYLTDDHTVADNSNIATRKCVGKFHGFESDGKVRVFLDPGYCKLVDGLNALALLTDSPASADALRDNIVSAVAAALL